MPRTLSTCLAASAILAALVGPAGSEPLVPDELYNAHHPRLLFTNGTIPTLRAKVVDGGNDDATYVVIRDRVQNQYPNQSISSLLGAWYGDQSLLEIALVTHLETPADEGARALGKMLTLHIANNYEPDFDEAHSGMRLRALAIGYDMFFSVATEAERDLVRDEIVRYIQKMIWNPAYRNFEKQPYLANHSAMFGAALGLAAIALQGETEAYLVNEAMAMADRITNNLLLYQFDESGSYGEGVLYALWTLKNLVFYFDARKRFDGFDYSTHPRLRGVEQWLAYELLPEGGARSHNLNDSMMATVPFARSTTYFDWALHEWGSGLSAWLWERSVGAYGVNPGETDQAAMALWHRPVAPTAPGDALPIHRLWVGRGLYHFRTGWQTGASSDDVVFTFYSGKFQGGHAQEDQNQFALYGCGERFVIDHGSGSAAKESEAHNMVFIDGQGQHNAGNSIGTDGRIAEYLLGATADYVVGDATAAYGSCSEYNAPDWPYPGADWSWGYRGANPVEYACRRVLVVHGGASPYFVVMDDIRKDGAAHEYEWRLHTRDSNTVEAGTNPLAIAGAAGTLDLHLLNPSFESVTVTVEAFNNGSVETDAKLLRVRRTAVAPAFSFLMIPRYSAAPSVAVTRHDYPWGYAVTVDRGGGAVDHIVRNDSGEPVTHAHIETDALVTLVRESSGVLDGYLVARGSFVSISGLTEGTVSNGTMTWELSGPTLHIDRYDADFRIRNRGVTKLLYRDQEFGFVVDGDYVTRGGATPVGDAPRVRGALALSAYPNPFNPVTAIRVDGDPRARTRVAVYDAAGRRVRLLWDAPLGAASRSLSWDGRDHAGGAVASGVYFLAASTHAESTSLKLTLLK